VTKYLLLAFERSVMKHHSFVLQNLIMEVYFMVMIFNC